MRTFFTLSFLAVRSKWRSKRSDYEFVAIGVRVFEECKFSPSIFDTTTTTEGYRGSWSFHHTTHLLDGFMGLFKGHFQTSANSGLFLSEPITRTLFGLWSSSINRSSGRLYLSYGLWHHTWGNRFPFDIRSRC